MNEFLAAGLALVLGLQALSGCGPGAAPRLPSPPSADQRARETASEFARLEDRVLAWLAAADPRIAQRADVVPSEDALHQLGTEAVLAEDTSSAVRGGSLDLFAFAARARAINKGARELAAWKEPLSDPAPKGSALERPRLERELLARLVEEERARAADEQRLGDASGDLVRGMVSTWTPPAAPRDWQERDGWAAKRLGQVKDSLGGASKAGRADVDEALDPLERLLVPMQFPRAVRVLTELRLALDGPEGGEPSMMAAERAVPRLRARLGAAPDAGALRASLEKLAAALKGAVEQALASLGPNRDQRDALEHATADSLFAGSDCGGGPSAMRPDGSRVRAMHPPPARAPICAALRAVAGGINLGAPLVAAEIGPAAALHDEILVALMVLGAPPRSGFSYAADDEIGVHLRRLAAARPEVPLGVGMALEMVYRTPAEAARRAEAWLAFGDAPLDVVARELFH